MTLDQLKQDLSKRTKRGLSFILASIIIWTLILIIRLLPIEDELTKNLLTFCVTAPLLPLSFLLSKIIKADFSVKENPLNNVGLLFSMNQFLYILIAMWVYNAVPEKMVMVLAVIFGAHLLPFGWLYQSRAYKVMSIIISLSTLIIGILFNALIVAIFMIGVEIIFSIWLYIEHQHLIRGDNNGENQCNANN